MARFRWFQAIKSCGIEECRGIESAPRLNGEDQGNDASGLKTTLSFRCNCAIAWKTFLVGIATCIQSSHGWLQSGVVVRTIELDHSMLILEPEKNERKAGKVDRLYSMCLIRCFNLTFRSANRGSSHAFRPIQLP